MGRKNMRYPFPEAGGISQPKGAAGQPLPFTTEKHTGSILSHCLQIYPHYSPEIFFGESTVLCTSQEKQLCLKVKLYKLSEKASFCRYTAICLKLSISTIPPFHRVSTYAVTLPFSQNLNHF